MKKIVLKYVLKNALDFNGKIHNKAVLGIILKENFSLKKEVPKVLKEINSAIKEITNLSQTEIKKKLTKLAPELLKERKKKKIKGPLKELKNANKKKIIVRIAPSPSGPLHVGHAYGASLNYEYAKMYKGEFIVRIEDTNPEKIYHPAYKLIEEDAQWLTENKVNKIIIQSERLGIYYDYAEKLINKEKAYVCECNADQFREMKAKSQECPCRNLEKKTQQLRYAKMFNSYVEGEAVLRLKTDITNKNPAMRDFAIMRINENVHPKTGKEQRVWPLMVFSVAIDDYKLGITHVLNGKDHTDNSKKEVLIMECFDWESPEYQHWGKINFAGMKLSSSETKLKIEQNEYHGWDDIRLPFLPALRKRGYQPESFRKFSIEIGLSLNDKKVSKEEFWKMINAFNKEIIEPKANRYFFVEDPQQITIQKAPTKTIKMELHPDFPKRGKREFKTTGKVNLLKNDLKNLNKNKIHRLIDYCNFKIIDNKYQFVSEDYKDYRNSKNKGSIIHWLPINKELLKVNVLLENGKTISGLGEISMSKLKVGDVIQLERFAFCSLVKKNKDQLTFWYLHK